MTGPFTPTDAERQTALSAENYLKRALRMLAERLGREKLLQNDPAGFAVQFAPLLSALIEAQAREYRSWVLYERLESLADANRTALEELGKDIAAAAQYRGDVTREGLAWLANAIKRAQP